MSKSRRRPDLPKPGDVSESYEQNVSAVVGESTRTMAGKQGAGQVQRHVQRSGLVVVHGPDKPVVPGSTGDDRVFADFSVDHPGVVPDRRYVIKELQFGFVADHVLLSARAAFPPRLEPGYD